MPRILQLAASLIALIISCASFAADKEFDSVGQFIQSLPGGKIDFQAYGDLYQGGGKDWAGVVTTAPADSEEMWQIYILNQYTNGKYALAAQSIARPKNGGTSNAGFEELKIVNSSVYVTWGWHWHECGGGAKHQFKFYDGDWRLLGAHFWRTHGTVGADGSIDVGPSVDIDRNVLTGQTFINFKSDGIKNKRIKKNFKPELLLLSAYEDGTELGWLPFFDQFAGC